MRHKRWIAIISLTVVVGILTIFPLSAGAFELRGGDRVIIEADEVVEDDLYVTAGEVVIAGTVRGDLVAVGALVEVKGVVDGDLLAAAQSVVIDGLVTDDARITGAALRITERGQVGDDVVGAGYSLALRPGGAIGGDLIFGGGQALLEGEIAGDARIGVNSLEVRGTVQGDVLADVGSSDWDRGPSPFMKFMPNAPAVPDVSAGLTVAEDAEIGSSLVYTATNQGAVAEETVQGEVTFNEMPPSRQRRTPMNRFLGHVRRFVGLLFVGLLMIWVAPKLTGRLADAVAKKPLPSFGWGILTFMGVGLAFVVLLLITGFLAALFGLITLNNLLGTVTVVGLLAIFALAVAFGLVTAYVAKIVVSFGGGRWLLSRLNPTWGESQIAVLVLGLVLFILLTVIPWVGGVFNAVIILIGLGALWLQIWPYLKRSSAEETA